MRLPRGSASSLLSLTAGLAAAAAVATTWLPVIRYAELREAEILSRQLALTVSLTAEQLSMQGGADLRSSIEQIPRIAAIDQAAVLPVDGEPVLAGDGLSAAALRAACPPDMFGTEPFATVPPTTAADGQRLGGGQCDGRPTLPRPAPDE